MIYNPNCTSSFSFVSGMVGLYYQADHDVQEDLELQAWIRDMSQEGFADLPKFGLLFISCFVLFFCYILTSRLNIFLVCFSQRSFIFILQLNIQMAHVTKSEYLIVTL